MNIKKLFTGVQLSTNVEITMMMTMKLSIVEIWISCVSTVFPTRPSKRVSQTEF